MELVRLSIRPLQLSATILASVYLIVSSRYGTDAKMSPSIFSQKICVNPWLTQSRELGRETNSSPGFHHPLSNFIYQSYYLSKINLILAPE